MKAMVGMDLGGEKSGAGWEKSAARYGFSVCGDVGKSRTYADCASGLCKGKGAGGLPPSRRAPPLAINALRVREAGVTVNKALINDSFAK